MTGIGYFMDDPRESARLAAKVSARDWVDRYVSPILASRAPTARPRRRLVVDVGCGPATLLNAVVQAHPDVRGVGIDISGDRLADARHNGRMHAVAAHARNIPLRSASSDLVYSRMLLEYLPRPDVAVAEMVRICRPGGTVLLQDLDGQLDVYYPPDPDLESDVSDVVAALAATGFDPKIGRKLFYLARAAGLTQLAVQVDGYHVIAGSIGPRQRAQWQLKLDVARPAIAAALGHRRALDAINRYLHFLDRPDTLTFSTQFTVRGTRPATDTE